MILVDDLAAARVSPASDIPLALRGGRWCHMVSTVGEDELHEFAARVGLRRSWAQLRSTGASAAHYDLLPGRRSRAVRLGAVEVSSRDLVRLNYDGLARRGLLGDEARSAADRMASRLLWGVVDWGAK